MKASIALQVLPLAQGIDRIAVIDQVIIKKCAVPTLIYNKH